MANVEVQWEGLDTLQGILRELPGNADKWLRNEMIDTVNDVFNETQRQVPVKTGALRGSGTVQQTSDSPFELTIGYGGASAGYALWVHENLAAHHNPPTKAKYVEDPMLKGIAAMTPRMQATVDGVILGQFPGPPALTQGAEMAGLARQAVSARRSHRRARAMTHEEISRAVSAIDSGQRLRARGERSIRRFFRGER